MTVSASADEVKFSAITFSSGQTKIARVIRYENGTVTFRDEAGEETTGPITRIKSIDFDETGDAVLNYRLLAKAESVKQHNLERYEESPEMQKRMKNLLAAVVVMYVDTEVPNDELTDHLTGQLTYRCLTEGGGTTGTGVVGLRQPWAKVEYFHPKTGGARRIELSPQPPYKTKSISIELKKDAVINLGRVVLEKDNSGETTSSQRVATGSTAQVSFGTGRVMNAEIIGYKDGVITLRNEAGKEFSGPIERVSSIEFGNTPREIDKQLVAEVKRVQREEENRPDMATVALYLDTEDPNDELKRPRLRCRIYQGRGSNSWDIPLRTPWADWRRVDPELSCRIKLEPGPPYKTKIIHLDLQKGGVANLGRVVLEKAKAN